MAPSLAISLPWASKAKLQPGRPIPHQVITGALGKLHLETKSAMAVLDPNGPRTTGPHASKPRTGRARETNGGPKWPSSQGNCLLAGEAQRRWGSGGAAACCACVNVSSSVGRVSSRGRCNILAVYVGGQRAQNGQGLALRRDGRSIEAKRNLLEPNCSVDQHGTTERPKALQGWTVVWTVGRDSARGWTDQPIRLSRHADGTSGALCGGRASAVCPS